jgi:hypothetical protein
VECYTVWSREFLLDDLAKLVFGRVPLEREKQAGPFFLS